MEKFGMVKRFGKAMVTKEGIYQKGTTTEYERRRRLRSDKKPFFESLIGHGYNLTGTLGHGGRSMDQYQNQYGNQSSGRSEFKET